MKVRAPFLLAVLLGLAAWFVHAGSAPRWAGAAEGPSAGPQEAHPGLLTGDGAGRSVLDGAPVLEPAGLAVPESDDGEDEDDELHCPRAGRSVSVALLGLRGSPAVAPSRERLRVRQRSRAPPAS